MGSGFHREGGGRGDPAHLADAQENLRVAGLAVVGMISQAERPVGFMKTFRIAALGVPSARRAPQEIVLIGLRIL
jgi:hypothetical protein